MGERVRSRRARVLGAVFGLLVGAVILIVVVAASVGAFKSTEIRDTQQENSPLLAKIEKQSQQIKRLTRDIRSCTTPGRPCYLRSQAATAKAVGDINRVVILAAACAPLTPGDVDAITRCVVRGLAEKP